MSARLPVVLALDDPSAELIWGNFSIWQRGISTFGNMAGFESKRLSKKLGRSNSWSRKF